jgi:hypothetical protein
MNEDGTAVSPARRKHWLVAMALTLAFVYLPQLAPLFFGPLSECGHCVIIYAKLFVIVPGSLMGLVIVSKLPFVPSSDLEGFILPGTVLTLLLLAAAITITASIRRMALVLWLALLATMSIYNALCLSIMIRA